MNGKLSVYLHNLKNHPADLGPVLALVFIEVFFIIPLQDFVSAVREKVLSDMEHKPPTHEADKWMANLAIMSVHLKEGNTFVRSIWLHLVGKVSENLSR